MDDQERQKPLDQLDLGQTLGRLEGKLELILQNQERDHIVFAQHEKADNERFDRVYVALGTHRDQVHDLLNMKDRVESHASTLLDHEERISAREAIDNTRAAVRANDVKWLSAVAVLGGASGAGFAGWAPKIWKALSTLFKP